MKFQVGPPFFIWLNWVLIFQKSVAIRRFFSLLVL